MADAPQPKRPDSPKDQDVPGEWYRLVGLGFEFVAAILLGVGVGYLVDYWIGSSPWGVIIGLGLGFAAGLSILIRTARGMFHD